jgi:hypothetical protein
MMNWRACESDHICSKAVANGNAENYIVLSRTVRLQNNKNNETQNPQNAKQQC